MDIVEAFEADVIKEWGNVKTLVVAETKAAYNTIKAALFGLTPSQWQDVVNLLESEAASFVGHDYGDMLQALLQWAETKGLPWLKTVEESVLVAAIAAWKASKV